MGSILVEFDVWHPRNPKHGDYTTNLALKLAKATGADPMKVAGELVAIFQRPKMQTALRGKVIKGVVYIPNKLINFVTKRRCNTETK